MSAAITAASIGAAGALGSAYMASKNRNGGSVSTSASPWLQQGSQDAISRAQQIANRSYTPFTGERVAPLSQNELQAQRLANAFGDQTRMQMGSGLNQGAFQSFYNPYISDVLGNQQRVIGEEYGRQGAALASNESAANAFRTGASDLARARLADSRMRALGDSEATGRAQAFDTAMQNYFTNQNVQRSNFESAEGALNTTGAADRSVRQANNDFNYGQFLENRDWSVNNLQPLLQSLSAAQGGSTRTTQQMYPPSAPWGAAAGLLSTAIGQYGKYRSGQQGSDGINWNRVGQDTSLNNSGSSFLPATENTNYGGTMDSGNGSAFEPA